jgi:hypothetical protein
MQFFGAGCAHYEFDLTRPADLGTHIGDKDVVIARSPLEYRFNAIEGRLVMRIYNTTPDPIQLLGDQSSVVDPDGQSHPLRSEAIAPQSFIKLILPPWRPHLERTGPSIGLGFGVVADRHRYGGDPFYDRNVDVDEPRYLYVADEDGLYWDWDGESDVRISLVFERGGERFTQDFVFRREKT